MTVLIYSVGWSAPVITSINTYKPEKIIYVVSPESCPTIRPDIEAKLDKLARDSIKDTDKIYLPDPENLLDCVRKIREGLVSAHIKLQLPPDTELIADFTGGTKVMSVSLALVMMEYANSRFTYTGGKRTKDGLGTVIDGHEKVISLDNPWEVMAVREIQQLVEAFNTCQYDTALKLAQELTKKIPEKEKFYSCLKDLVDGYLKWDSFDHKGARSTLQQAIGRMEPFTYQSAELKLLAPKVADNKEVLTIIQQDAKSLRTAKNTLPKGCGQAFLKDLVANARRRAESGRYDDAVARLYSAIEKCAKIRLMAEYGINNSDVDLSRVHDESLHEELKECVDADQKIKLPLQRSFLLLQALGHPMGQAYHENAEELENQLHTRNMSLLAHGYETVSEKSYEALYQLTLTFLGIEEKDLPVFITLDWKTLIV